METNAEQLLDMIKQEGEAIILRFIEDRTPETRFLDFKRKTDSEGAVKPSEDDKKNYVKALSGFANAEGGLLIWGVGEIKTDNGKVAFEDKSIKDPDEFVKSLNSLLPGAVAKPVEGVSNFSVKKGASNSGFAVTYVPGSSMAPHRGELKLKSYFQRIGDNFIQMEHFQIEDMFGRRQRPSVTANLSYKLMTSPPELHKYNLIIDLENNGRSMASFIGVDFEFPADALANENTIAGYDYTIDSSYNVEEKLALVRLRYNSREEGKAPLFPKEKLRIVPNSYIAGHIRYHVNDAIYSAYRGKELKITVYADSVPPKESKINFNDLNIF